MKYSKLLLAASIATLTACGGSSGTAESTASPANSSTPDNVASPVNPTQASKKISATGTTTGTDGIETDSMGTDTIVVNGENFVVTESTVVAIEGKDIAMGNDSAIKRGMRVTVEATDIDGVRTANRIVYDEDLMGPAHDIKIDETNPSMGSFSTVNQHVVVDENTVFDTDLGDNDGVAGIDIRDLAAMYLPDNAPMVVEVSGLPTETGLLATRIDRVSVAAANIGLPNVNNDELKVSGFVDSVNATAVSLSINGATFDVTNTEFKNNLNLDDNLVGVFVEVKADLDEQGKYIAVHVERKDDFGQSDDDIFEIEGVLQSVDTSSVPNVIVINGVNVEITNAAKLVRFVGGRIEIKGNLNSDGVLDIGLSDDADASTLNNSDEGHDSDISEIAGTLRQLDANQATFSISSRAISLTSDTVIDESIIEMSTVVSHSESVTVGEFPENLDELLSDGDLIKVEVNESGNAVSIEAIAVSIANSTTADITDTQVTEVVEVTETTDMSESETTDMTETEVEVVETVETDRSN